MGRADTDIESMTVLCRVFRVLDDLAITIRCGILE
ncbi:hypothetical protein GFPCMMHI_03467 [Ensifer adhaerens]|jgi:hypothetical protein|nr:hypothetical protein [Ensifer adhaerens]